MWTIQLLGSLAAVSPQRQITRFRTQKAASLLAYLAFHAAPNARPRSREALVAMLWPDADPEAGRHNLSNALSFLRRMLEPPGIPVGAVILADRNTVRLHPGAVTSDVVEFEKAIGQAREEGLSDTERMRLLLEATQLYQGPLLPGFYEDWITPETERLESMFISAVSEVIPLLLTAGTPEPALALAQRAVTSDPWSQAAALALMQVLVAIRQPSHALRVYRRLEARMAEDLSAEPSRDLKAYARELHTATPLVDGEAPAMSLSPATRTVEAAESATNPETATMDLDPGQRLRGAEFLLRTTTRFFGREEEVQQLCEMLSTPRTRLVTLTGPGGTGKTRLALEVAGHLIETAPAEAPRTAVFVSLADVSEPERLCEVVLRACGVSPAPGRDMLEQLAQALDEQPGTLLVLDNFDALRQEGGVLVRDLLAKVATVQVLVTSRQKLYIEGENGFPLGPLATSGTAENLEALETIPSVGLFVDRAQAARPDFHLTERNAPDVSRLCQYLEGIPLAIELAAARAGILSPARILDQVQANRLDFLATRRHDVPARQRTLRATLDWSFHQLPEDGQGLMSQLSVFRGGWTVEAVLAVSDGGEQDVLDLLMLLRDGSLVSVWDAEDGLRFTMLETVREHAAEWLDRSDGTEAAGRRHAEFFVSLLEEILPALQTAEGLPVIRQIGQEQENLRAALRWVDAHPDHPLSARPGIAMIRAWLGVGWERVGRWLSGVRESNTGAGTHGANDAMPEPLANLLVPLGGFAEQIGDPDEMMARLRQLLDLHPGQGETVHNGWTLVYMGCLALQRSLPEARRYLEEAEGLMREAGTAIGLATAFSMLARVASLQGMYGEAGELGAEALSLLTGRGDTMTLGHTLLVDGYNARDAGDYPRAHERLEQSMAVQRRIENAPGEGMALVYLGLLALDDEDFPLAERQLERAQAIFDQNHWDTSFFAAMALCYLAMARLGLGHAQEAEVLAGQALPRFQQRKSRSGMRLSLWIIAELEVSRGQAVRAARLLAASEAMRRTLGEALAMKDQEQTARLSDRLLAELGPDMCAREQDIGSAWTEEEAVAYALGTVSAMR